jgi:hypothetical protein
VGLLSAVLGIWRRDARTGWLWQLPTVAAFLVISREFGQRHFMYLLPALSYLAAWLLVDALRYRRWSATAAVLLLGLIVVPAVRANAYRASWVDSQTQRVVALIQERTDSGDVIVADDIGLAFYARRPTTYSGAALSHGAVTSNQITGEKLIDEIVAANARMVLVDVSLLTGNHIVFLRDYPRFHRFLENNFQNLGRLRRDYQEIEVWWREAEAAFETGDPVDVGHEDGTQFGEHITLLGYSYESQAVEPGDVLRFTLFFRASAPAENYWSVFAHLVAPDGTLLAQEDKVPYGGVYPPNRWWPGQIVDDDYEIQIPEEAAPGAYRLQIGMYDWQTGERLGLFTPSGEPLVDNQVSLETPVLVGTK